MDDDFLTPELPSPPLPKPSSWAQEVDEIVAAAAVARQVYINSTTSEPFDHASHSTAIKVKSLVGYSWQFLETIGMGQSYMAQAKGRVTSFVELGGVRLAVVKWLGFIKDLPTKVNVANLAPVGPNIRYGKS